MYIYYIFQIIIVNLNYIMNNETYFCYSAYKWKHVLIVSIAFLK